MLILAVLLLGMWGITQQLPYILLCLSYAIGASISILVREAIAPSPQTEISRLTALLLLLISLYGFADFLSFTSYHFSIAITTFVRYRILN